MAFIWSLALLLSSSDFSAWSQPTTWIDSNDLVQEIFRINRDDSKNMEQLMELHTRNGELDGWAYNEALKQQNPSLYLRMLDFRKIHNELESENIDAMKFIDHLLLTSRGARHGEIRQPQETISIVDNFIGLSSSTREYLMKKFPALRIVFSGRVGVTGTPASRAPTAHTTTTAPTRTTTTKTSSSNEERKLIKSARRKLAKLIESDRLLNFGPSKEALEEAFKEVLTIPSPWQLSDLKPIFENINEFSKRQLDICSKGKFQMLASECAEFILGMADIVDDVLSAAAKADPKISSLRQTFQEMNKWNSDVNDVLQLIQTTLRKLNSF